MLSKGTIIAIVVIIITIIAIALIATTIPPTETSSNPVKVNIDNEQFQGNITDINLLNWGIVAPGYTYTKNFTVQNTDTQALNIILLTTEPTGNTQTWVHNNTQLTAGGIASGTLTLTLDTVASIGTYTWRLIASNNTTTATPTPDPSATPTPRTLSLNIDAETGANNVNVTINADKITLTDADLPRTINFQSGDTLTFKTEATEGYTFNYWEIDGNTLKSGNPLVLSDVTANFTITAKYMITPTT